jgi:Ni,Fe-hydrogenase III small subunit
VSNVILPVVLPLLAAFLPQPLTRLSGLLARLLGPLVLLTGLVLLLQLWPTSAQDPANEPFTVAIGGFTPPIGIVFYVDQLALIFAIAVPIFALLLERLGIQPMVTPRQTDILLVTGYVSVKTLKRVILTYEQMPAPKYVIGICSCTVNGGMYWQSYATAKKLNDYMPVDMYIAGCMPRPEAVIAGLRDLRLNIEKGGANAWQD